MRPALLPTVGIVLALAMSGCTRHGSGIVAEQQSPAPSVTAAQPSPEVTASAPDAPVSPSPSPTQSKPLPPPYDVKAVQTQLTALHYYEGPIDGEPGPAMASAVMAFQKVQGIGADGIVGKGTLAALKAPRAPSLRASSPANHVEVDLTRQVLYVVKNGAIVRILPVSSGNGHTYLQKNGRTATALTPVGWYTIQRRIIGVEEADLGTLYDPEYFYRGWAIHGSNSVPAYPASHGCIRVTRTDAKYLLRAISVGISVYVYGGTYTFPAGSSAPGTDNPTGDTSADAPASPSPSPSPSPRPSASPGPTAGASPSPTASPTTAPVPTATATATPRR